MSSVACRVPSASDCGVPRAVCNPGADKVNGLGLGIEGDQGHIGQPDKVLPGDIGLALGLEVPAFFILYGKHSPPVHGQVVHSVRSRQGPAVLVVVENGNGHAREGVPVAIGNLAPEHGGPFGLNRSLSHPGLNGIFSGVEKFASRMCRGYYAFV